MAEHQAKDRFLQQSSFPWEYLFHVQHGPFDGCVTSLTDLNKVINEFEKYTLTKFVSMKNDRLFGKESQIDLKLLNCEVRWEDTQKDTRPSIVFTGVPFVIIGKKLMECHHGIDRNKKRKDERKLKISFQQKQDHSFTKRHRQIQVTKKKSCLARIRIRHVLLLQDYKISVNDASKVTRETSSVKIRAAVRAGNEVTVQHCYYVSLPTSEEHQGHVMGEAAGLIQPMEPRLRTYICKMVTEHNITSSIQMCLLLEVYVKQVVFFGQSLPPRTNNRFWPSIRDIRNHMLISIMKLRHSSVDQTNVEHLVAQWRVDNPKDKFHLRLKEDSNSNSEPDASNLDQSTDCDDVDFSGAEMLAIYGSQHKFLYVHQTQWQTRLLSLYGNEICLLDATYRTSRYALPVFFLCVPTNCNYMTVASFIVETEDSASITEALSILKEWNPQWNPKYFMCDYAKEEINAIEHVFPGSFVYLCDFHREQAWDRWLSASHNDITQSKSQVLILLRAVAQASSPADYERATEKLQKSSFWSKISRWFTKNWQSIYKRWVRAFRQDRFHVSINTNNGVERQNRALKYEYLHMKKAKSLSNLLTVLTEKFLPDSYVKYLKLNLTASDSARAYSASVPSMLQNRPRSVVKHCFVRWEEGQTIDAVDVELVEEGVFTVKSQTHYPRSYKVTFRTPSCECADWMANHLPCKHFMAVFTLFPSSGWECLPCWYKDSPFLNLDSEILGNVLEPASRDAEQPTCVGLAEVNTPACDTDSPHHVPQSLPVSSSQKLRKQRSRISTLCELLKDWSNKCRDATQLEDIATQLNATVASFRPSVPQEDGMILDHGEMVNIGTNPAKKKTKKVFHNRLGSAKAKKRTLNLPIERKRKKQRGGFTCDLCGASFLSRCQLILHRSSPCTDKTQSETFMMKWKKLNLSKTSKSKSFAEKNKPGADEIEVEIPKRHVHPTEAGVKRVTFSNDTKDGNVIYDIDSFPGGGLQNLAGKNLCFANAVLQCLRLTDVSLILRNHLPCVSTECFVYKLRGFIDDRLCSAENLCKSMTEFWCDYRIGQQEDSHEFWQKMMQEIYVKCTSDALMPNMSNKGIYRGLQESQCRCTQCSAVSIVEEAFTDISLPIQKALSIDEALMSYFSVEIVHYTCSSCLRTVKGEKKMALRSVPKYVVLHLKRFTDRLRKNLCKLEIPEIIRLHPFVRHTQIVQQSKARLIGVIFHKGTSLTQGHYYAYVCCQRQWFIVDDMKIRQTQFQNLQQCPDQAYMLFYETLPRPYIN